MTTHTQSSQNKDAVKQDGKEAAPSVPSGQLDQAYWDKQFLAAAQAAASGSRQKG